MLKSNRTASLILATIVTALLAIVLTSSEVSPQTSTSVRATINPYSHDGQACPTASKLPSDQQCDLELTLTNNSGGQRTFKISELGVADAFSGSTYAKITYGGQTPTVGSDLGTLGNDGFQLTVPTGETHYYRLRITVGTLTPGWYTSHIRVHSGGGRKLATFRLQVEPLNVQWGVTLSETSLTMAEPNGQRTYTVNLNSVPGGTITIKPMSVDDTVATVSPATLTFTTSDYYLPQTVTVTAVDDDIDNAGNQRQTSIRHEVSGTGSDSVMADNVAVTVTDNNQRRVILNHQHITLNEYTVQTSFMMRLASKPVGGDVTIALVNEDTSVVTLLTASLTFTPSNWKQWQHVDLRAVNDFIDNPNDHRKTQITATLTSSGDYNGVTVEPISVTVTDDDTRAINVRYSITHIILPESDDPNTGNVNEHQKTYRIRLATEPDGANATVNITSGNEHVATVSPSSLTFTADNYHLPQTVTVTAIDDDVDNPNDRRRTTIVHTGAGADYEGLQGPSILVTVTDDDTTGASPASVTVQGTTDAVCGGDDVTYILTLDANPATPELDAFNRDIKVRYRAYGYRDPYIMGDQHIDVVFPAGVTKQELTLETQNPRFQLKDHIFKQPSQYFQQKYKMTPWRTSAQLKYADGTMSHEDDEIFNLPQEVYTYYEPRKWHKNHYPGDRIGDRELLKKYINQALNEDSRMNFYVTHDPITRESLPITRTAAVKVWHDQSDQCGAIRQKRLADGAPRTVSIVSQGDVLKGEVAKFEIASRPLPSAPFAVNLIASQEGDYSVTDPSTVTSVIMPTSGRVHLEFPTADDGTFGDGSITLSLLAGDGYLPSLSRGAATVNIKEFVPTPPTIQERFAPLIKHLQLNIQFYYWKYTDKGHRKHNFERALKALGVTKGIPANTVALTLEEARYLSTSIKWWSWGGNVMARLTRALEILEAEERRQPAPRKTRIYASAIDTHKTEGDIVVFRIIAVDEFRGTPKPVNFTIMQRGEYLADYEVGSWTVMVPDFMTRGPYNTPKNPWVFPGYGDRVRGHPIKHLVAEVRVRTVDDEIDEPDGGITLRLDPGPDYEIWKSYGVVSVAVVDDEDAPVVSISADGDVEEGEAASFTVTATPAPHRGIPVRVSATQSGDYGIPVGGHTVIIPVSGSATLSLPTTDDIVDEPDGSVTATLNSDTTYTVSDTANDATVLIADDDDTPVAKDYTALISKMYQWRNDPQFASDQDHLRRWDRALLALGETVTNTALKAMRAPEAVALSDQGLTGWGEVAGALIEVDALSDDPVLLSVAPTQQLNVGFIGRHSFTINWDWRFGHSKYVVTWAKDQAGASTKSATVEGITYVITHLTPGTQYVVSVHSVDGQEVTSPVSLTTQQTNGTPEKPEITIVPTKSTIVEGEGVTVLMHVYPPYKFASQSVVANFRNSLPDRFQRYNFYNEPHMTVYGDHVSSRSFYTEDDDTEEADGQMHIFVTGARNLTQSYTLAPDERSHLIEVLDNDGGHANRPRPEVRIESGTDVTEGTPAVFIFTTYPKPHIDLPVKVTVTQVEDYGTFSGEYWVTIPTTGRAVLTLATIDDEFGEADGTITATLGLASAYRIAAAFNEASVTVSDNDGGGSAMPEVSIAAADIIEGESATFTVTADPAPDRDLTVVVRLAIGKDDDFGISSEMRTVIVPAGGGSVTFTVSSTDDGLQEGHGSVTATVQVSRMYTVSATDGEIVLRVYDDETCWYGHSHGVKPVWVDGNPPSARLQTTTSITECLMEKDHKELPDGNNRFPLRAKSTVWTTCRPHQNGYYHDHAPHQPNKYYKHDPNSEDGASAEEDHNHYMQSPPHGDGHCGGTPPETTTTPQTNPLGDPGDVTFSTVQSDSLQVSWPKRNVDHYVVYWSTAGTDAEVESTQVDEETQSYTITGLLPDEDYLVKVLSDGMEEVTSTGRQQTSDGSDLPEISITAGADVSEGEDATFTVTANPAPTADLDVTVIVAQTGDFGVTTGPQTVTIPTSGSVTLTVTTVNDGVHEQDGTVTATVNAGSGYRVSGVASSGSVAVSDDDPAPITCDNTDAIDEARAAFNWHKDNGSNAPMFWRILNTLGADNLPAKPSGVTDETITAQEAKTFSDGNSWSGWTLINDALECAEQASTSEVSVTGGSGISEGGSASFTISASPAPPGALTVTVEVTQSGDFGVTTGPQTVTIPTSGSATLFVATIADSVVEADGSVTVTVSTSTGYRVSATAGTATVAVADYQGPEISISSDGDVTEGDSASFTVTAAPAPPTALSVSVAVTQSGEFGVTTGPRTVSIPTSGSATLTVATLDDQKDETDGSVTASVSNGTGYTVSTTAGTAIVAVADDDDPSPKDNPKLATCDTTDAVYWSLKAFVWHLSYGSNAAMFYRVMYTLNAKPLPAWNHGLTTLTITKQEVKTWSDNRRSQGDNWEGWTPIMRRSPCVERVVYEVSITAGNGITEGGSASFTVSADPAPESPLTVSVAITQSGDFAPSTASRSLIIPTSGSATLSIPTTNDGVDEADGSITATVNNSPEYYISATAGTATVDVSDDDGPAATPEISIVAGSGITEGDSATFTVTANPAPSAALSVSVAVSQSGDFGVTSSSRTVSIPTSGSATLSIATINDSVDEADGSVTATVSVGTGYTVSATASSGSVAVSDDDDPPPSCDVSNAIDEARAAFQWHLSNGSNAPMFWRILNTLSADNMPAKPSGVTDDAITAQEAKDFSDGNTWDGWPPINEALACVEAAAATPEVSITAGSGITEGDNVIFTVSANPAPSSALSVTVSVAQTGDFGVSPGSRTVVVPTTGSATLTVTTSDDSVDEANGSVTATVNSGTGYTVSGTAGSAIVPVADDDVAPPNTPEISIAAGGGVTEGGNATYTLTANPAPQAPLSVSVSVSQSGNFGVSTGSRTVVIPTTGSATLTVTTSDDSVDEANGSVTATVNSGTGYTVSGTAGSAIVPVADDDVAPPNTPEISIAAGGGVTEGGNATYTLTANPAPQAPLSVSVSVSQSGNFGVSTGSRTVVIPTTGSATLTVATSDDAVDEANGSVTATVNSGTGYTVSGSAGTAVVAVNDDDVPEISITGGSGVTEGGNASFTITANPAPAVALSVSVSVAQSGNFGVATGSQTVTIPTSGSVTLTIATSNDSTDESNGSVTVTVNTGSGYSIGAPSSATVAVADDDPAPPNGMPSLSVADVTANEGDGAIAFTVTLSQASNEWVRLRYSLIDGTAKSQVDYKPRVGYRLGYGRLYIAPGVTSVTISVLLIDDQLDDGDKSFAVKLTHPNNATIGDGDATGTIIDND